MLLEISVAFLAFFVLAYVLNWFDYRYMKAKHLKSMKFDLNMCCGDSPSGGVNADVVKRNVPGFVLIKDIYKLPFKDKQFKNTICSHALEHVSDPKAFFKEMQRVSENVVILVPPVWDYGCMMNIKEHRWQFLTLRSKHVNKLPAFVELPLSDFYQKTFGQKI